MKQRFWCIEGHDSFTKLYEQKVKVGCFSGKQMQALLMALTAKASLDYVEIVGAYANKNTKIANEKLFIEKDGLNQV